jgi:hypothetical protein
MCRLDFYLIFSLTVFLRSGFPEIASSESLSFCTITQVQDTLFRKQNLYNGRVWQDIYSHKVTGDQFLFSKEFIPGSVTVNGKSFNNIKLRYDICNDEIMIITDENTVLQLNKEMVDMFTLNYRNIIHQFSRLKSDSINSLKGYVEVLYTGNTKLYVKYIKEIFRSTQGRISDVFQQSDKVYVLKDGVVHQITRKKDFIALLIDKKLQVRNFIKTNRLSVSGKNPQSILPVLKFYDSLNR